MIKGGDGVMGGSRYKSQRGTKNEKRKKWVCVCDMQYSILIRAHI